MAEEIAEDTSLAVLGKILWDIVPCDQIVFFYEALGLVTPSAEGMKVEHAASHARLDQVGKILAVIGVYAEAISRVCTAMMLRSETNGITPEYLLTVNKQSFDVATRALISGLSQLLDDGILKYAEQV